MSGSDLFVEFRSVIRVRSALRLYHLFIKRRLKIIQVAVWRYI